MSINFLFYDYRLITFLIRVLAIDSTIGDERVSTSFLFLHLISALRGKSPNTEFFLIPICLYSDWIRRIVKEIFVFIPNTGKCRPEKTPYLDIFHEAPLKKVQTFIYSLLIWDDRNYSFETTVTRNLSVIIKLELDLLRKKCPYLDLFRSIFFLRFLAFGLHTERYGVPLRIQSESGKMWVKCGPE